MIVCFFFIANASLGTVLLAISEWSLPKAPPSSSSSATNETRIPNDMLSSCHELLAAHARGIGGDLILRLCGLSRSLGQNSDDALRSAASFAALHDANTASVALVMQARWRAMRGVFHEILARIAKRDIRRRCRQVSTQKGYFEPVLGFVPFISGSYA